MIFNPSALPHCYKAILLWFVTRCANMWRCRLEDGFALAEAALDRKRLERHEIMEALVATMEAARVEQCKLLIAIRMKAIAIGLETARMQDETIKRVLRSVALSDRQSCQPKRRVQLSCAAKPSLA